MDLATWTSLVTLTRAVLLEVTKGWKGRGVGGSEVSTEAFCCKGEQRNRAVAEQQLEPTEHISSTSGRLSSTFLG